MLNLESSVLFRFVSLLLPEAVYSKRWDHRFVDVKGETIYGVFHEDGGESRRKWNEHLGDEWFVCLRILLPNPSA